MARRIREEIVDDDDVVIERVPRRRRVVTERRIAPYGPDINPIGLVLAAVLVVFIIVLFFGYLL